MATLKTLSYSKINGYLACPLKFYYTYVEGLKPAWTPAALAFGSTIHKAIESRLQAQMEGRDFPLAELEATFEQDWKLTQEREDIAFKKDDANALEAQGKSLLVTFYEAPPLNGTLVGIEEAFEVELTRELPPFVGRIDALFLSDTDPESIHVVDFKTASASYDEGKVRHDVQLSAYALAMTQQGYPLEKLSVGFEVLVKTKMPKHQRLSATRSVAQLARFLKLAERVYDAIKADVFYPRRDFHCVDCPYRSQCEGW